MRLNINKCSVLSSSLLASKPVHTKGFTFTVALLRRELKLKKKKTRIIKPKFPYVDSISQRL